MDSTFKLFDYQEKVIAAVEADPSHSQLISMPTGTGKTVTFLN
jgi:superfamily II DNA or RNA helicase